MGYMHNQSRLSKTIYLLISYLFKFSILKNIIV